MAAFGLPVKKNVDAYHFNHYNEANSYKTVRKMRYDYRCHAGHINTQAFPMGKQPETVTCEVCGIRAERYFGQQRVQTADVLWPGRAPAEIPVRGSNPIGALAYM